MGYVSTGFNVQSPTSVKHISDTSMLSQLSPLVSGKFFTLEQSKALKSVVAVEGWM